MEFPSMGRWRWSGVQAVARLKVRWAKLLELYYEDRVSAEAFGQEEQRLTAQIAELPRAGVERDECNAERSELAQWFEEVAELLSSVGLSEVREEATERERRTRVEGMLDAVFVHPDHVRGRARGNAAAAGRAGRSGTTATGGHGTVGVGGGT